VVAWHVGMLTYNTSKRNSS